MSHRTPGVMGFEPPQAGFTSPMDITPPDAGLGDHGPVGLDSGGRSSPASLVVSGWPRALTWDDFRELDSRPADAEGTENAQIHSDVNQPERVSVAREGGQRRVSSLTVTISIISADTWVVRSAKTPELLSHEQGHYDITGLTGRDMGNEILAARAGSLEDLQRQVTEIIERARQRAQDLNARYDTETRGGQDRDAQRRWDERIRSSIAGGTPFSAP
jgi:hypothetical protein